MQLFFIAATVALMLATALSPTIFRAFSGRIEVLASHVTDASLPVHMSDNLRQAENMSLCRESLPRFIIATAFIFPEAGTPRKQI